MSSVERMSGVVGGVCASEVKGGDGDIDVGLQGKMDADK